MPTALFLPRNYNRGQLIRESKRAPEIRTSSSLPRDFFFRFRGISDKEDAITTVPAEDKKAIDLNLEGSFLLQEKFE